MDHKKLWEAACAVALVFTMVMNVLTTSRAGLTNWWGVVFSPLCSAAVCD